MFSAGFVVLAVAILLLLTYLATASHDPKEPPLIPQPIPYVGHMLGLLRTGSSYYSKIRLGLFPGHMSQSLALSSLTAKFPLPIYTLRVPRISIYVVNSPGLVAAVERNTKSFSFDPLATEFAKRLLCPSTEAMDAVTAHLLDENMSGGCRIETLKAMRLALAPGDNLDRMSQVMLESICRHLDSPGTDSGSEIVDLYAWTTKPVTRASTDAVYGPSLNPFTDPEVEAGFWAFHKDFALLGLNFLPTVIARKSYYGREKFFQAFYKYYAAGCPQSSSHLVQARYEVNRKHNVPLADIARFDLSLAIALLLNSPPSIFWILYYTYSHPSLLTELRAMLSTYIRTTPRTADSSESICYVDISDVIAGCPLLMSIMQETLRLQATNASDRIVMEDTVFGDQYLLKQGSLLLMPAAVLHRNASSWGSSFKDFDPQRFVKKPNEKSKRPTAAYRAFGGGSGLCPGRYFSVTEILAFTIVTVLKYDMSPELGHWVMPESSPHIVTAILIPINDIKVKLSKRAGYENHTWKFSLKGSGTSLDPTL